jgi:AcrR family transcriptional regulator
VVSITMTDGGANRLERRKATTRAALVSAAQRFLAAGLTSVSIQGITEAADVGFGSFYNHFDSKEALFEEAIATALETWGVARDAAVAGMDDPAEIFAASFRMSGRMQRQHPELIRVVLNSGTSVLLNERGLRPRALADIERGIKQGRFTVPDPQVAVMAAGGALLALLQMLDADPDLDDATTCDAFAERVLLMFGMRAAVAAKIVARPLPPMSPVL